MKHGIFSLAMLFILAGCAQYEAVKDMAPIIIDQGIDKTYELSCNMRYRTEARFRARHDISKETVAAWCKR